MLECGSFSAVCGVGDRRLVAPSASVFSNVRIKDRHQPSALRWRRPLYKLIPCGELWCPCPTELLQMSGWGCGGVAMSVIGWTRSLFRRSIDWLKSWWPYHKFSSSYSKIRVSLRQVSGNNSIFSSYLSRPFTVHSDQAQEETRKTKKQSTRGHAQREALLSQAMGSEQNDWTHRARTADDRAALGTHVAARTVVAPPATPLTRASSSDRSSQEEPTRWPLPVSRVLQRGSLTPAAMDKDDQTRNVSALVYDGDKDDKDADADRDDSVATERQRSVISSSFLQQQDASVELAMTLLRQLQKDASDASVPALSTTAATVVVTKEQVDQLLAGFAKALESSALSEERGVRSSGAIRLLSIRCCSEEEDGKGRSWY